MSSPARIIADKMITLRRNRGQVIKIRNEINKTYKRHNMT